MAKITLIIDMVNGLTVPDTQTLKCVYKFIDKFRYVGEDLCLRIGSELLIQGFRVAILQGRLHFEDLVLIGDENETILFDCRASPQSWPRSTNVQSEIIKMIMGLDKKFT